MRTILSIKHWTLFLLFLGPPLIAAILADTEREYEQFQGGANLVAITVYFIWIWTIAHSFSMNIPNSKLVPFNICFFGSLLSFVSLNIYFLIYAGPPEFRYLHIFERFVFVLWLYCLYVAASLLKTWELRRPIKATECLLYAFLFLVFPIGVWILQPKINKASSIVVKDSTAV